MTVTAKDSAPASSNSAAALNIELARKASRRGRELMLLIYAAALAALGLLIIQRGFLGEWSLSWLWLAGLLAGAFGLGHVVVRALAKYADPVLLPMPAFLLAIGLVVIRRVDLGERAEVEAQGGTVTSTGLAPQQFIWIFGGLVLMALTLWALKDHRTLVRYTYVTGLAGLFLLLLPGLLPASISEVNGAKIWIKIGPFSIQPMEFAKPLMVTFFAGYLTLKREVLSRAGSIKILGIRFPRMRDAFPLFLAWILTMLILVLEGELGTTMLFYGAFIGMLYVATNRAAWAVLGIGAFVAGYAAMYFLSDKVANRVDCWLNPMGDASGSCFQLVQAQYGIAAGGLFGTGLGAGNPELVPEARTDFIFAAICELLGLFGAAAVLMVIMYFVTRGSKTALLVRDDFGRLLAVGLAFTVALQYLIILGGVTRVLPLTGITAPFLSYGGSSTLANFIIVGLLIRISNTARRPPTLADTGPPVPAQAPVGTDAPTGVIKL